MRNNHKNAQMLAGVALTSAAASFAHAQDASFDRSPLSAPSSVLGLAVKAQSTSVLTQQLEPVETIDEQDDQVIFEADLVSRESEDSPIVASGNVRAYFGERFLTADRLVYNPLTDIVVAEGNVAITDENLETIFAGRVELTGDLRDGIADNFSALLEENARLAAASAVQRQGARTRLTKAVYTSCNVCNDEGEGKTPTWRIKALRVTRDRERKVVRFRHAFFELKGIPILYAPYIQGPDPSVERQSGFLTPLIGTSTRLGFNVELPYYLAFSDHTDATFFPRYTTLGGTLWQGEIRRHGRNSYAVFSGGVINADELSDSDNNPIDAPGVRWNLFGRGHRDFGENWRLGFDVERVSDNEFLQDYNIRRRGDLRTELDTSNSRRLRSSAYAQWSKGGSDLRIDSYLFQGLRADDRSELTPYVLPLVNYRHQFQQRIAGGKAQVRANIVSLQRKSGVDTRRFTANAYWERSHITKGGHRFKGFAELRADAFHYADLDEGTEQTLGQPISDDALNDSTRTIGRVAPTVGADWSYPLTKRVPGGRFFLEPRVQLIASLANRNSSSILNEDSQSVEFDYFGLFEYNKSPGLDRVEDGQRLNAGIEASAVFDNGLEVTAAVGEQFRLDTTDAFDPDTGLGGERSHIVGAFDLRYKNRFGVDTRFRVNDDTGSIERAEATANFNFWRIRADGSYVRLRGRDADPAIGLTALPTREEVTGRASLRLSDHWGASYSLRHNVVENRTLERNYILKYSDECSSIEFLFRRDETKAGGEEAENAFLVRFTLASLVD